MGRMAWMSSSIAYLHFSADHFIFKPQGTGKRKNWEREGKMIGKLGTKTTPSY